jgi:hypothetical protein
MSAHESRTDASFKQDFGHSNHKLSCAKLQYLVTTNRGESCKATIVFAALSGIEWEWSLGNVAGSARSPRAWPANLGMLTVIVVNSRKPAATIFPCNSAHGHMTRAYHRILPRHAWQPCIQVKLIS